MRPFVHLNLALTADGRFGQAGAEPLPISCPTDWQRVHQLRERYDAVAVGAGTWHMDGPRLTARPERLGREPTRQPDRVVFSGRRHLRVEPDGRRTFVIGAAEPPATGVIFIQCVDHDLVLPLGSLLRHGVRSLLVEGGPSLLRSFLAQARFDRVTAYVAVRSPAAARRAAHRVLGRLPAMDALPLGDGVLLSGRARP